MFLHQDILPSCYTSVFPTNKVKSSPEDFLESNSYISLVFNQEFDQLFMFVLYTKEKRGSSFFILKVDITSLFNQTLRNIKKTIADSYVQW